MIYTTGTHPRLASSKLEIECQGERNAKRSVSSLDKLRAILHGDPVGYAGLTAEPDLQAYIASPHNGISSVTDLDVAGPQGHMPRNTLESFMSPGPAAFSQAVNAR